MKLIVQGGVSKYEVSIRKGDFEIVNIGVYPPRRWDLEGHASSRMKAAEVAVQLIQKVDGPVEVECDEPGVADKLMDSLE